MTVSLYQHPDARSDEQQQDVATQRVGHALGDFATVSWRTDLFRADTGTFTVAQGDLNLYQYRLVADVVEVWIRVLTASTSSGMGTILYAKLPDGLRARDASVYVGSGRFHDGTTNSSVQVFTHIAAFSTDLIVRQANLAAFTSSITDGITLDVWARVPVLLR